jgi:hypothetical protein
MFINTLDQVVASAMADIGETSTHKERQFLHWAIEGYGDFLMDSAFDKTEIRTLLLPMNEQGAVPLPEDFVDWTKVGVQVGRYVKNLSSNTHMSLTPENDNRADKSFNITTVTEDDLTIPLPYYNYVNNHGEHKGGFYGYGAGTKGGGHFIINRKLCRMEFKGSVPRTNVYMEYLSNCYEPCKDTFVHEYAAKAIKLYIHWMRKENNDSLPIAVKERARQNYFDELRMARARCDDFTLQDLVDIMNREYKLSVKG